MEYTEWMALCACPSVIMDRSLPCGKGSCVVSGKRDSMHNVTEIVIGCRELCHDGCDHGFMFLCTKSVQHEIRHAVQGLALSGAERHGYVDDELLQLLLWRICSFANMGYCRNSWNYHHCFTETDAEFCALKQTYGLFLSALGKYAADRLLFWFMHGKKKYYDSHHDKHYFVPFDNGYDDVGCFFDRFLAMRDQCSRICRVCDMVQDDSLKGRMRECMDGMSQDILVAADFINKCSPDTARLFFPENSSVCRFAGFLDGKGCDVCGK